VPREFAGGFKNPVAPQNFHCFCVVQNGGQQRCAGGTQKLDGLCIGLICGTELPPRAGAVFTEFGTAVNSIFRVANITPSSGQYGTSQSARFQ